MRIAWSTGYRENYWGDWWTSKQVGGSERIVIETATAMAALGHEVTVRLPYVGGDGVRRGVRYIGPQGGALDVDLLFCADDFAPHDRGVRRCLVACRSDPPPHADFDALIFLSAHHAALMGYGGSPHVGGGVDPADYATARKRIRSRVICTSSPDRCPTASGIGRAFDFIHTYRPVGGVGHELDRAALIEVQQTALVHIYPLDPIRPSDFFSMSVLESLAAGTPVIVSDADSMPELWSDCAVVLPRPIRIAEWVETVEELMANGRRWRRHQAWGRLRAEDLTWDKQAHRYLDIAREA